MKKYCSIAQNPGTFGERFHNEGYRVLGLTDSVYFALKIDPSQLGDFMDLVRPNFAGVSVSKPHKEKIIEYLDEIDPSAQRIGAVNTVLNNRGSLKGFNTDYYGAKAAISSALNIAGKNVVMLGSGGVARAIGWAVKDLGGNLTLINRTLKRSTDLAKLLDVPIGYFENLADYEADLFINATSIGMINQGQTPLSINSIKRYGSIMDVVVKDTALIREARNLEKRVISGDIMTLHQANKQFEIYTGKVLPQSFIQGFI